MTMHDKILYITAVSLFSLIIFSIAANAQGFNRVTREDISFSLTFGSELLYLGSGSYTFYQVTPYVYGVIGFSPVFQLFIYLPFQFTISKEYAIDYDQYGVPTGTHPQIDYCGGLPSVQIGTQFTFYTTAINDIYCSLSIPIGVFPAFYFRNSETYSASDGWFSLQIGYRVSWITDPVLFYVNPSIVIWYKNEALYSDKTDWYHSYSISCKTGFSEVLNGMLSYSVAVTTTFSLPTFKKFDGVSGKELYSLSFTLQLGFSILLTEETRLGFTLSTPIIGYLQPTFELYFTVNAKQGN